LNLEVSKVLLVLSWSGLNIAMVQINKKYYSTVFSKKQNKYNIAAEIYR
jgi:hypothetical protein